MIYQDLRAGMVIHHAVKTIEAEDGARLPFTVRVGIPELVKRYNYIRVPIRHGMRAWGNIVGSPKEIEEELKLWHEGEACQDCLSKTEVLHERAAA